MKAQILILFISIITLNINASGDPLKNINTAKTLSIETSAWKADNINVNIKTAFGENIWNDAFKNSYNIKNYSLKNLPIGDYILEVSDDLKINRQSFTIGKNDLVLSSDVTTEYKPLITFTNNNIDVNLLSLGKKANISITNEDNTVAFNEKLEIPAIHKRYDLSNLPNGRYSILISVDDRDYYKSFTK